MLLCPSCSKEHKIFAECGIVVAKYNAINHIWGYANDSNDMTNTFYVIMLVLPYCEMKRIEVSKHFYEEVKIGELKMLNEKETPEMPMQRE